MSTRKNRTRVLTAGAVAAAVALAGAGYGIASAAEDPPALAFRAVTHDVQITRYVEEDGNVWMDFDLGVNLIAGKQPFEIRAKRKNYAQPIVATQEVTGADGKKSSVPLPSGLFSTFDGFKDFTAVTIKDGAGATVREYSTDWCPNTWNSLRTRPDAPSSTPYPQSCAGGNPFILGSVWGVQAGYNSPVEGTPRYDWQDPNAEEFDLAAGKYQITIKLNDKYRSWLAVPADSATVDLNVTVEDYKIDRGNEPEGAVRAKAAVKAAAVGDELPPGKAALRGEHSEHDGQGDASVQVSAYHPDFRPPAKVPATLAATPKSGPKPDLRSLPAWGIDLSEEDGKTYVNFGATVWNAGTSPLVVDGFRRTGTDLMDAYQYFFDSNGKEVGSVEAGTMEWDPREGHFHWHFTDFAQYNLLSSDQSLAVRSGKEAFCLANTDAVDYTIPNAKWRPENTDLSTSCGANTAVAVREVLDIGNGDTYSQARPGQSFEITDLPNGTYFIQTLANPANKLAETKTDNNSSLRKIVLGGKVGGKRTLKVPAVNGIEG